MKIILVGSPEGKAAFVQSMQHQMDCEDAREMSFHFPEHSNATVTMTSLSVEEMNQPNVIKEADAIIYAGMRALHKKALEVEFLPGFSAGTLLKNLTRLLQDHRRKTH